MREAAVSLVRQTVALRDIGCVAPRIDKDCGPCRDRWGNVMSNAHRFMHWSDGEMDFVRLGATGKRHELPEDHVWLCPWHHQGTTAGHCWATSHREQLRDYLDSWGLP